MEDGVKKITFAFSKRSRLPAKPKFAKASVDKVQYIDSLDNKSIKIKGSDGKSHSTSTGLVIPLSTTSPLSVGSKLREVINIRAKELADKEALPEADPNDLDSIAVRELLEDVKKNKLEKEGPANIMLDLPLPGSKGSIDKESTLEDYETVPVSDYGLAMLRGMGWDASKGIGKNEKLVATLEPKVRPRGMGLGVVLEKSSLAPINAAAKSCQVEEELKVAKGSYVKVIRGSKKDVYGQIEGFCEETGRLILKMALGGASVSMSEFMVQPVTKDEFTKNSRVLNASKYNEYKDKERNRDENGGSKHTSEEGKQKQSRDKNRRREGNTDSHYSDPDQRFDSTSKWRRRQEKGGTMREEERQRDSKKKERSQEEVNLKHLSGDRHRDDRRERRNRSKSRSPRRYK